MKMNCMNMAGGVAGVMMIGMAVQWLLVAVLGALGIAALVKYLRTPTA